MPKAKPLSKEQILAAQAKTKSNMAAASDSVFISRVEEAVYSGETE